MYQNLRLTMSAILGAAAMLGILWGCTSEQKTGQGPDPSKVVASITIKPATLTIPQGTTVTFVYYGTTVGGDSVTPELDWVANGGALGPDGEFTATRAGTFSIIGTNHNAPRVGDTVTVTVTPLVVVDSTVIIPQLVTVQPGATRVFAANAYLSDHTVVPATVNWSATGGTINAGGSYLAGNTAGTFRVDAIDPANSQLLDTATVIIANAVPTLQKVDVTPATVTLAAGGTQQFAANGKYSDGSTLVLPVTWSTSGGSINASGLYTAGNVAGTYNVIGTHSSGKADTSVVTLTGTLAHLNITPHTIALQYGGTTQFSTVGVRTDSSTTPVTVNYTAGGGTITQGGFYTAGQTAGTYHAVATDAATGLKDSSTVTVTAPPPVVVSLNLLPASASVLTGGTKQFAAQDVYNNGTTTTTTNVSYIASGGTINSAGLYTAPGVAGIYQVIATSTIYGFKDTTNVDVSAPASLTSITISPANVTIGVGGVVPFVAIGHLSNGTTSTVQVAWTLSGGGSITSGGLFTAGASAGQFQLIAQLVGGTLRDTAAIFVVSTPPPSNNEPVGYLPFAIHQLSEIPAWGRAVGGVLGSWYAYPPGGGNNLSIGVDPTAPQSPDSIIRTRYYVGMPGGVGPVDWGGWDAAGLTAGQKTKVYFSMWVKIEGPDFENQSSGTKAGFLAVGRSGKGENELFFWLDNGTGAQAIQSNFQVLFKQQGIPQPNGQITRNMGQNVSRQHLMTCGIWHHWETVMELNAIGQSNGIFKMWIDGVMTHNYSDVTYVTPSTPAGFHLFKWNPTWGGSGGTRTRVDFIDIDHVYFSGVP